MSEIFHYIAAHDEWFLAIAPFVCLMIYFAIESRWEAYTRRKNYEELKILHDLRDKNIITQEDFDKKKADLLGV